MENHDEILVLVLKQMKKRGRKPAIGETEHNVWDDPQYKKDYFNDYYKNVIKNKPIVIIQCECGKEYQKIHKSQHNHSKHHKMYIELKKKFDDKNNI